MENKSVPTASGGAKKGAFAFLNRPRFRHGALAGVLGFYNKRADFIRMAVSNQITLDESFEEKLERVKDHKVQQKRSSDEIIQSVLRNMSNDSEGVNGMMSILETVIRESNKPKRVTQ